MNDDEWDATKGLGWAFAITLLFYVVVGVVIGVMVMS